tara:strand:- start:13718 stop:14074 length:357 start_codon:yes stop_codon:yes gene_type:complete
MSLDMSGHIGPVFKSGAATRTSHTGGGYVDGLWVDGTTTITPHTVTVQPASDREIETLEKGGDRVVDARRIYVNDGLLAEITQADTWTFDGQEWKCYKLDNRPWRNYCKAIVARFDDQ